MDGREEKAKFDALNAPLKRRVENLVSESTVKSVNDGGSESKAELQGDPGITDADPGEVMSAVPMLQTYGFACNPPVGSKGVCLSIGANSKDRVGAFHNVIDGDRPSCEPGEARMWSIYGQDLHFREDDSVELVTKPGVIIRITPDGEIHLIAATGKKIHIGGDNTTIEPGRLHTTVPVARVGDQCEGSLHSSAYFIALDLWAKTVVPPFVPPPASPIFPTVLGDFAKVKLGSDTVRVVVDQP